MYELPDQHAYCDAYNTGHTELEEISETLEHMEIRRTHLERVVVALVSCINIAEPAFERGERTISNPVAPVIFAETQAQSTLHEVEPIASTFARVPESPKDAMQRRIDDALRLAVA